jgi:hypothetical protein
MASQRKYIPTLIKENCYSHYLLGLLTDFNFGFIKGIIMLLISCLNWHSHLNTAISLIETVSKEMLQCVHRCMKILKNICSKNN